ncbi:Rho termination factor N-terminal domain-containing protein, partial [Streptomyces rhizosphaericola]
MSDTTDLMGVTADKNVDSAAPAEGAASGTTARRRRSGTGLEGMVLAELQQVASGLGIRGTARMRKSQLIEVIKEAQAGGGAAAPKASAKAAEAPAAEAESKPKRRATSKARTGDEAAAEKPAAQQQIDIPGQPASDDQPAGERRRRRATAQAGSPDTKTEAKTEVKAEQQTELKTEERAEPKADAKAEAATDTAEGRRGDRQGRDRGERGDREGRRERQ